MKFFLLLLISFLFPPAVAAAPAKPDLAIAAVVGQEAISSYDVESRLKFVISTARLSSSQEVRERLKPQIIRTLIDESLEMQEAAKHKIAVSDQEVAQAIATIEQERGMKPGAIFEIMRKNGIPKETFTRQIRAQLAWRKLVTKKIRPLVRVSEEEIKLLQSSPSAAGLAQELQLAILLLPVDSPARETEVRRLSERLAGELRGGADFEEVSRQFAGARAEKFWVRPEQLDPSVGRMLVAAQPGTITVPVRTGDGYAIAKVYDVRMQDAAAQDAEVTLKEILLKLKADAPREEADALLAIAGEVAKHPGMCEDKGVAGLEDIKNADIEVTLRKDLFSALPAGIRTIVEGLKTGEISTPFASDSGIRLYMLCERKDVASSAAAERIRNRLYMQKLELEAQKYLMGLRRETYIEIR